ncbi:hypothetical protein QJS66_05210 [Kocuria rhizophila]|nr:hypothetical protein QJS66_05210 [Kocuria rhizophila]
MQRVIAVDLGDERLAAAKSWGWRRWTCARWTTSPRRCADDRRAWSWMASWMRWAWQAHGNPVARRSSRVRPVAQGLGRKTIETVGLTAWTPCTPRSACAARARCPSPASMVDGPHPCP